MVPNAKALVALGLAFAAGVSTIPLVTAVRSPDAVRSATGSGSPAEPGPASRVWENPNTARTVATNPAQVVQRDARRRSAAADPSRPLSPSARPTDGALQAVRTTTAMRQARPLVASAQENLADILPPPARRRTLAEVAPIDGSASKHARPAGNAPVQPHVQKLAGDFQGRAALHPVLHGDGLVRWLSE